MANVAIVYGSKEGQTGKIAGFIADALMEQGQAVELVDGHRPPSAFALDAFDGVIVGSSVHVGKHDEKIVDFVKQNLDALRTRPSAFFSVSLTAVGTQDPDKDRQDLERLLAEFSAQTGWQPDMQGVFAGALRYSRYNPIVRFVMKKIAGRHGGDTDTSQDYEYTDWRDVTRFVTEFAGALGA
ncbi:MAG: menaquinone-dependent protoporphyrinogen IX dehydrogenase [Gammaproteobacteria bacterium]